MSVVERVLSWYRASSSVAAIVLLVVFNLLPLVGALFWGWNAYSLLVLYWVENGIVGVLNVPKILLAEGPATPARSMRVGGHASKAAIVPFFLIHYGMFWFVHGIFVMTLPLFMGLGRLTDGLGPGFVPEVGPDGVPDLTMFGNLFAPTDLGLRWEVVAWGAVGLALSHGASFVFNYLGRREYLTVSPPAQAFAPYGRLVTLHVAIILGAFVSLSLGGPLGAVIVLVLLKTAIDLALHIREHRAAQASVTAPVVSRAAAADAPLEDPRLGGVAVVDGAAAGRAVPAGLEGRAAELVAERFGVLGAAGAPVGEEPQRAGQVVAVGGQGVFEAWRALLVRPADEDPLALEAPKTVDQDVRGDRGQQLLELAEAARPVEQRLDQEQAPAVADALERGFERARTRAGGIRSGAFGHGGHRT